MIEEIGKEEEKAKAKELIEQNQKSISLFDKDFEVKEKYNFLQRKQNDALLIAEWNDVIEMRKNWSRWLLRAILAIIIFDFFIIFAVGIGWMKFDKGYIVPFFVGESLIKTLGLAIVVVKFLFNSKNK